MTLICTKCNSEILPIDVIKPDMNTMIKSPKCPRLYECECKTIHQFIWNAKQLLPILSNSIDIFIYDDLIKKLINENANKKKII